MTALPATPVLVITVFACLVTALRMVFVRDSVADRLINRALGFASVGMVFLLVTAGSTLPVLLTLVGAALRFLTAAGVYGVARVLDGADPKQAGRRQRRYDRIAWSVIGGTAALDVAYFLGFVPESAPQTWYVASGILACLPVAVAGFLLVRAGLREIRAARTPWGHRVTFSALIGVAGFWIGYTVLLFVRYLAGMPPSDPGKYGATAGFTFFGILTGLLAIPLARMALVRAGLDRDSRDCRRLRPLWADLTAAVPHVALAPDEADVRSAALRRYRMTVEIRDALLQLRRHAGDLPPHDPRAYALRVVRAAEAGLTAAEPGHDSELRHLLGLADRWPRVKRDHAAFADGLSAVRASR
ncbi:DUF6545 domain-containing protein [Nocardia takedensis]|uniref:DUF6545 domain-containing protein n=1 Tax=Nocardia takedensis TaxID=259390 RepID=UPI000315978F|nr:DUF6545 domain-containing protein [Nocardia takedensis]